MVCALLVAACKAAKPTEPPPNLASSESWCPDGFEVGPQDTCFAIPEAHGKDTPVLVYLHGMYAGHGSAEEWKLVHTAAQRGFAVVIPRGKRGLCAWKAELKDHFCWPQEAEDPHAFKTVVADWERVLWQVDALLEGGTHNRYVLGFSNGGYFASYLATHGMFNAHAYAIVNAGPLAPPPKPEKAVPILLVSARDDTDQAPKMKELHDSLSKAGWAHAFCARPGVHALAADDVDAALKFFKHDQEGSLKPQPDGKSYGCEGAAPAEGPAAPAPHPKK
jgi:poly(3-hydroxybutyrate) depolymerase